MIYTFLKSYGMDFNPYRRKIDFRGGNEGISEIPLKFIKHNLYIPIWYYLMSKTAQVSAKVPEELKKKAKELGINISRVTREALQERVMKEERKRLREKAKNAGKILKEIPSEDIVKRIRETRESS